MLASLLPTLTLLLLTGRSACCPWGPDQRPARGRPEHHASRFPGRAGPDFVPRHCESAVSVGNPAAVIARQTVAKATALGATAPSRAPVIRAPLALRARPGKVGRAPSVAPGPHSAMGAPRPAYTKSRPHVPAASSVAARGPSSSPPPPPRPLLRPTLCVRSCSILKVDTKFSALR